MKKLLFAIIGALCVFQVHGQRVGLKTNALSWTTGTASVYGEMALGRRVTVEVGGTLNAPGLIYFSSKDNNSKIWHWNAGPEFRLWHVEAFNRGFVGLQLAGGAFDAGGMQLPMGMFTDFAEHRYEGWQGGVGLTYGWQWWLSPHFNIEASVGVGYRYIEYNRFAAPASAIIDQQWGVYHYFGPTRLHLGVSYLFRSKK